MLHIKGTRSSGRRRKWYLDIASRGIRGGGGSGYACQFWFSHGVNHIWKLIYIEYIDGRLSSLPKLAQPTLYKGIMPNLVKHGEWEIIEQNMLEDDLNICECCSSEI